MTEPTNVYLPPPTALSLSGGSAALLHTLVALGAARAAAREAVAAWEQWTDARSFDEHTAAATRLDAAMLALREVAT